MNKPHGGCLIDQVLSPQERIEVTGSISNYKALAVDKSHVGDIRNIARGVYSPLRGFLREEDFREVLMTMRLKNGTVWPIPIVLDMGEDDHKSLKDQKDISLTDRNKNPIAILKNIEIFEYDKSSFIKSIFGTTDRTHPGVRDACQMKRYLVGGDVYLFDNSNNTFPEYNFSPSRVRRAIENRGWRKIAGFQTRNLPHRGHELLQRSALEIADGLLIHPVVGEKKLGDFRDEYIIAGYKILIDRYYLKQRIIFSVLPLKMRYAGPREALLHALIRKNFGCTHFVVGRDHAGVKNYYQPFSAQEIFGAFKPEELGIEVLRYPEVAYCKQCRDHLFINGCSHRKKFFYSATLIRKMVKLKKQMPTYIIRREVYDLLTKSSDPLVDNAYKKKAGKKGFVIWLTGLPKAGKTTIGDKIYEMLKKRNLAIERLDGDVLRWSLTKNLGFSKKGRHENIKMAAFLAGLLSKNGVVVVASFVSPYRSLRSLVKKEVANFIEIFVDAPVKICEKRDKQGLYRRARMGKIANFTGVSDPYEKPKNPAVRLDTKRETIKQSTQKVIEYLEKNKFI